MATKSIMKNVSIKDRSSAKSLVLALEHAKEKKAKEVVLTRTCSDVSGDKIKALFGNNQ